MNDDTDPWPAGDSTEATCETCGERRPCQLLADPFLSEIEPGQPSPPEWYCRACYTKRADQI